MFLYIHLIVFYRKHPKYNVLFFIDRYTMNNKKKNSPFFNKYSFKNKMREQANNVNDKVATIGKPVTIGKKKLKVPINKSKKQDAIFIVTPEYRELVSMNSSLGEKGYTILKSALSPDDIAFLKKDLTMKPITMGSKMFGVSPQGEVEFPVWRENDKKMYLPRFYGIARYGEPAECKIGASIQGIDVVFTKELRDYQTNIISIYMNHVSNNNNNTTNLEEVGTKGGGAILEVPCGRGKTVMAIKIVSELKVKTLILVHKEFLMNQWIERLEEFLPGARIGKIQGPVFDIEGKDIVIGMIQTMYSRDFSSGALGSFGLTIIDEVHRIGSEEFSKTLLKTVTPYMLGISATVERKDGLAKLLYHFIGPKIYSEERAKDEIVSVRGIEFVSRDTEFSATEYDFRGMPKYSTMISKLCDFGPRTDFITKCLMDLFIERSAKELELEELEGEGEEQEGEGEEQEEREHGLQVMVLAHNRSLLTALYDRIIHRGFATVGYYVGGMKESDLKVTEGKQIVLATYAMAAEALDIKTLSVLVMATPKTDIEQSVGRILRSKHENPIIIDIIDSHDTFQNQWRTRKRFYKKCNYRILYAKSIGYIGFPLGFESSSSWKTDFEPKSLTMPFNSSLKDKTDNSSDKERTCLLDVDQFSE